MTAKDQRANSKAEDNENKKYGTSFHSMESRTDGFRPLREEERAPFSIACYGDGRAILSNNLSMPSPWKRSARDGRNAQTCYVISYPIFCQPNSGVCLPGRARHVLP